MVGVMVSDNRPKKHHYLPIFYLKRWAGPDGKIVEFSRPYGRVVKPRRTAPAGTGFEKNLYTFHGLEPERAQLLETGFFSLVDSGAADALALLENHAPIGAWTPRLRQAWVTFLFSLITRMPLDIAALKASISAEWNLTSPGMEEAYLEARGPDDPPTAAEYFSSMDPRTVANIALRLVPGLIQREGPGEFLMNMHWFVMESPSGHTQLLTSDRPLLRSHLLRDDAYWHLPIGPNKMFWAVRHPKWEGELRRGLHCDWVRMTNQFVLRRAWRYGFARTDSALGFVQQHLSAETLQSIFQKSVLEKA